LKNKYKVFTQKILSYVLLILVLSMMATGCSQPVEVQDEAGETTKMKIDAKTAKSMMETESNYIILDVRTQEEYNEGHIPNSVLLPNDQIGDKATDVLPDKDQMILIYCRSGNRSGQALEKLAELGYTQIYDFGGIIDWPYEVVTE